MTFGKDARRIHSILFFLLVNPDFFVSLYPRTRIKRGRNCRLTGNGRLHLGTNWEHLPYAETFLYLGDDAQLEVSGDIELLTGARVTINPGARLSLGSGMFNNDLTLDCFEAITIGHNVVLSKQVIIRDSDNHQIISSAQDRQPVSEPVYIEDNVWVGIRSTILKGVRIGKGSVVAAGSVVVSDVPPGCLVGGVPARVIKEGISWE